MRWAGPDGWFGADRRSIPSLRCPPNDLDIDTDVVVVVVVVVVDSVLKIYQQRARRLCRRVGFDVPPAAEPADLMSLSGKKRWVLRHRQRRQNDGRLCGRRRQQQWRALALICREETASSVADGQNSQPKLCSEKKKCTDVVCMCINARSTQCPDSVHSDFGAL